MKKIVCIMIFLIVVAPHYAMGLRLPLMCSVKGERDELSNRFLSMIGISMECYDSSDVVSYGLEIPDKALEVYTGTGLPKGISILPYTYKTNRFDLIYRDNRLIAIIALSGKRVSCLDISSLYFDFAQPGEYNVSETKNKWLDYAAQWRKDQDVIGSIFSFSSKKYKGHIFYYSPDAWPCLVSIDKGTGKVTTHLFRPDRLINDKAFLEALSVPDENITCIVIPPTPLVYPPNGVDGPWYTKLFNKLKDDHISEEDWVRIVGPGSGIDIALAYFATGHKRYRISGINPLEVMYASYVVHLLERLSGESFSVEYRVFDNIVSADGEDVFTGQDPLLIWNMPCFDPNSIPISDNYDSFRDGEKGEVLKRFTSALPRAIMPVTGKAYVWNTWKWKGRVFKVFNSEGITSEIERLEVRKDSSFAFYTLHHNAANRAINSCP